MFAFYALKHFNFAECLSRYTITVYLPTSRVSDSDVKGALILIYIFNSLYQYTTTLPLIQCLYILNSMEQIHNGQTLLA